MTRTLPLAVLAALSCIAQAQSGLDVHQFGAKGDGQTLDSPAVNQAIDKCAADGGGTVYFPPGVYLCGSIHLKSNVALSLDRGATIKASLKKEDFDPNEKLDFKNDADVETTYFHFSLIWGEDVERVAITGEGVIDSNHERRHGPKTIALKRCRYADIKGVTLKNTPNYPISLLGTDYVNIDGVTILNAHADGIDPDSCRNVRISNCHIESFDDAIVPKSSFSLGERRACENLVVTNCILSTECNGFKLGTESGGDFKRIAVSNCVITGLKGEPAAGGISLESVDGANIDGVVISNITMRDVRAPIFLRLGNRGRDMEKPIPGSLKNVAISNVVATAASFPSSVTGIPGHPVEGVSLSNIRADFIGGNPAMPPEAEVPELENKYPEPDMFGMLPAYAFYARHVKDLTLDTFQSTWRNPFWRLTDTKDSHVEWLTPDGIPQPSQPGVPGIALVADDVDELVIANLRAQPSTDNAPLLYFAKVRNALVRDCLAPDCHNFIQMENDCANIITQGNVLPRDVQPSGIR